MILNNFLYRLADYARQNRARLIRLLLIVAAAFVVAGLIYYGVEKYHAWRYEKRAQALERQFQDADQKARDAESRADVLQRTIEEKYAELRQLEGRAKAVEDALRYTRGKVVTLKENYETIRYVDRPVTPVSCQAACVDLGAVGYPCK